MSINRRTFALALVVASGLLLGACGKKDESAAGRSAGADGAQTVYVVGTDAAYAPFEFETDTRQIAGFDIDVMKAVADKAGISVRFVNTPFEGIFNSLVQGDRDILISAITITDERRKQMDFSAPYFEASQLIAVPLNSTVQKFDDLKSLKVGVQTATTGDEVVQKLMGKNNPSVKRFEGTPLAMKELEAGGVDAVVADNGVVVNFVANNPDAKLRTVSDSSFPKEYYGIAVRKGDAELLGKINKGIEAIKADGTYDAIFARYFGKKS
ncbi:basic amino acid ABC transporter substrate-binding protein [Pandoraea cepalis]|uniref:Basic amino acid ABC transporter substrate-binding protein n=1 Tax=Pandoraea cepalis TaxID=2508294 RepID=A0AAW7MIL2_9BURK|nr:basic amino acid ABC transporter substrate-binding protein [Pandoraea cepalis]MDN4572539.1 basic amino acid ABC transporter substrate-binding protein [Pandoraea cepalis]MDN4576953.1 basic amino acid ABC transporter substrate-binding protein [Pandoraea cepalis]